MHWKTGVSGVQVVPRNVQCWGPQRIHWCFGLLVSDLEKLSEEVGIILKRFLSFYQVFIRYLLGASDRVSCLLKNEVQLFLQPAFMYV